MTTTDTNKTAAQIRAEMIAMSHWLGEEQRGLVIVGEGNTSARTGPHTNWIKASGSTLATLHESQVVEIDRRPVLSLMEADPPPTDGEVTNALGSCRVDPAATARPSVETFFHALLYELTDAQFIGHTHPVAVNGLLCSKNATDIARHIMPDVVVVCGPGAVFVPYCDPGVVLAREIGSRVSAYLREYGESPRVIYLQSHGLIALGQTPRQVQNVTAMAVKHAQILQLTYAAGGPNYLSTTVVDRIHVRPDEEVRRRQFR